MQVLGGGGEVGGNAFLIQNKSTNVMLDYGVKIQPEPPTYPISPRRRIDAIILSHSHLDHCGGIPALYTKSARGNYPTFFTNEVTLETTKLLIKDSMKISKLEQYPMPFNEYDVKAMVSSAQTMSYRHKFDLGSFKCEFYDAGHIPGSVATLLMDKDTGKRIFYTGDIGYKDTHLLKGCNLPNKVDTLILESTYAKKDHPPRQKEEERFIQELEETLANNEKALIPVFAVGRSQEVLLTLEKYANKAALDGMAKAASDIILQYPNYIREPERLRRILDKVMWVQNQNDRKHVLDKIPIIVSTAGMLSGGPMVYYLKELKSNPNVHLMFTGFLVEDSPGRNLIKTSVYENDEEKFHFQGRMSQYDFSGHAGHHELLKIIEKTQPSKVICIHGDHTKEFAAEIRQRYKNIETIAPKNGETVKI